MTIPRKPIQDVTVYIEDYARYLGGHREEEASKWGKLWSKLSHSQKQKLVLRAREFNLEVQ